MHKHNRKGFTLAELLIVVAIIAVLVAISIPIFATRLEKSREAADLANVRSAYAAVTVAANTHDQTATYNGETIYRSDTSLYTATVPLKQTGDGWVSTTPVTVGGVVSGNDGGSNTDGTWLGQPRSGGACIITCSTAGTVTLTWDGDAPAADPYNGAGELSASWFTSAKKMSGYSFMGSYSTYDTGHYSQEEYDGFVEDLKERLGITGDNFYFDFSTSSRRLRYTTNSYSYNESTPLYSLPNGETYTIVDFDADGSISKIYTNTVSTSNRVSFGKNGRIVAFWDHPENYELIYDASAE